MEDNKNKNTNSGQEGNQNWDDQNDQQRSGNQPPNPERFKKGGSAFNEEPSAAGYGAGQKNKQENPDQMESDSDEPPTENLERKDIGASKTGPDLG